MAVGAKPVRAPRSPQLVLWRLLVLITTVTFLLPVRTGMTRLVLIGGMAMVWVGALYLSCRLAIRILLIVLALGVALPYLLPNRPVDKTALQATYCQALVRYQGTPYIWGGETRLGIDCSGLLRRALMDAEIQEGLRTGNGALIRSATDMWWHDCSARALGEEYRGQTRILFPTNELNSLEDPRLLPGDIAVTADGIHTLAYLGNRIWIEADPLVGHVIAVPLPSNQAWFTMPVRLLRWHIFDR